MIDFEVVEVVLSDSGRFRRKVLHFIEIVFSIFRNVLVHDRSCCLRPTEVRSWPWRRLSFVLVDDRISKRFSWIFIHLARQRPDIFLNLVLIRSRHTLLDLEHIINII